jgi:alpha-1,3-rhamnosyl/mannosyltransferase
MRVVMNGLAALKPRTGVGHHVANLALALAETFPDDEFTLYPGSLLARIVRRLNSAPPASGTGRRPVTRAALTSLKVAAKAATRFHFATYTRAYPFHLYHEPNFVPFRSHLPTVVTVHDLSVLRFPHWHPADRVRSHVRHFVSGVQRAVHVIVVSESVRRELIDDLGLPAHKVTAVPNGVSPAFRPHSLAELEPARRRLGLPARYFLCVGTIEPRKNVGAAMRAFADLPAEVRSDCRLLLAGPWGWKADADRAFYDSVGRERGVRHLGYVTDADLPAVYAGALGLVYPSHYEGFGLPPIEMLASGGAVLASDIAAVREVCGQRGAYVAPDDIVGWRTAMQRLATDADYHRQLCRGGTAHAARFTWVRTARETYAVYRHVLGLRRTLSLSRRAA